MPTDIVKLIDIFYFSCRTECDLQTLSFFIQPYIFKQKLVQYLKKSNIILEVLLQYRDYYKQKSIRGMSSHRVLTHLQGVDVSDHRVVELSRENLISAGFEKCPDRHRHLLVHAVQFQLPLPSLASMQRTDKRNKAKAAKGKAKPDIVVRHRREARRKIKGSHKRRAPTSLPPPSPKSHSTNTSTATAFKARSPEQSVLKGARQTCEAQLEEWFGKCESKQPEDKPVRRGEVQPKGNSDSNFPIYFQKRHRSHKRRIRERWELIKANRDKLVELYGSAILDRACRISIREVKAALGLENQKMDVEGVGEFMAMINEDEESSSYSSSNSRSYSNSKSAHSVHH